MSFWNNRYKKGQTSGLGSIGKYRDWKWSVINLLIGVPKEVIDAGCGDLSFWEGRDCESYIGIDISEDIVIKNQAKRPKWFFVVGSLDNPIPIKANCVFCMDVLFHIMDNEVYEKTLKNLAKMSTEWIVINTWRKSPFKTETDGKFQYFRNLLDSLNVFHNEGFELVLNKDCPLDEYNTIYVFKKTDIKSSRKLDSNGFPLPFN